MVAVVILVVGYFLFEFFVYYPWKHGRNLKAATEWNDKHWEAGEATFLTYTIPVETPVSVTRIPQQVMCYHKQDARPGGLKGPPSNPIVPYGEGTFWPNMPVGEGRTVEVDFRFVCRKALSLSENWSRFDISDGHRFVNVFGELGRIGAEVREYSCLLGVLDGGGLNTKEFRLLPVEIQKVEKVPLREAVQRTEMIPSETHYSPPPRRQQRVSLMWDYRRNCWADTVNDPCISGAERLCGTRIE